MSGPSNLHGLASASLGIELSSEQQNNAFCFFFLKRDTVILINTVLGRLPPWGPALKLPVSASPSFGIELTSAKQNNTFYFFSWKKNNTIGPFSTRFNSWLSAKKKKTTLWFPFLEKEVELLAVKGSLWGSSDPE